MSAETWYAAAVGGIVTATGGVIVKLVKELRAGRIAMRSAEAKSKIADAKIQMDRDATEAGRVEKRTADLLDRYERRIGMLERRVTQLESAMAGKGIEIPAWDGT